MNLQNPAVLGSLFAVVAVIGIVAMVAIGRVMRARNTEEGLQHVSALCQPLGLGVLPSESSYLVRFACAGDFAGHPTLVFYVRDRRRADQDPPGVRLVLNGQRLPSFKGSVYTFLESERVQGDEGAKLQALLTPTVREMAKGLPMIGALGLGNLMKGSVLDLTIRERWPSGWTGVMLQSTLPVEASSEQVRAALEQMGRVADAMEREAGT